jgi:2-dehydropantoate 2-reductase
LGLVDSAWEHYEEPLSDSESAFLLSEDLLAMARIIILGAGVQGTLYGVRLADAGHEVTLVARGRRADELRTGGAIIEHALTGRSRVMQLPVIEEITPALDSDLCLVTVRREQLESVLPHLKMAHGIARVLFMVNHACGSEFLFSVLGSSRAVLGFPGAAGTLEHGIDRYVEIAEQPTSIEASAPDIAALLEGAGFRVSLVKDMDSWLRRHAVFVTAIGGALYESGVNAQRLSRDNQGVRSMVLAVREGWAGMDRRGIARPPMPLRAIFQWVPLAIAVWYWQRLIGSQGEYYFAHHTRHAVKEMAALAADVRALLPREAMPHLEKLFTAIDTAAQMA